MCEVASFSSIGGHDMNKLSTVLTTAVAAALAGTAAHAQTLEQQTEQTYEAAKQTTQHAYQEGKQEVKEAYKEGKQAAQQAWQETKEETRDTAQSADAAVDAADRDVHASDVHASDDRIRTAGVADSDREDMREDAQDAQEQVSETIKVVRQMKQDPQVTQMLQQARGVFIVPTYGKAAAVVGGRGGEGVLLLTENGKWSNPAFYNFGRVSAGAQAGAAAGSIAMMLMTEKAVDKFRQDDNWALDATAGLTIVNYSADTRASSNPGDVVVWSDTKGLFAGASIGVSDIARDDSENAAYYKQRATPQQIFSGKVQSQHAETLREALPQVATR
jgi:SH3 domain-containing YSC84-like protein 1